MFGDALARMLARVGLLLFNRRCLESDTPLNGIEAVCGFLFARRRGKVREAMFARRPADAYESNRACARNSPKTHSLIPEHSNPSRARFLQVDNIAKPPRNTAP